MHGYGIIQNIAELSNGRVNLGAGTLYGAINTLLEKGWITPVQTEEDSRGKINMKKVVWKMFANYEKEEKFINEMSEKGWALTSFNFCRYTFEEAPKGEYIYRMEYLEHPIKHEKSQEYLEFMKENGIEVVTTYLNWVYFRKKSEEGPFTIYSDIQSKLLHYSRLRNLYLSLAIPNIVLGIIMAINTNPLSPWISFLNLIVGLLLISAVLPLNKKIALLEKEEKILE